MSDKIVQYVLDEELIEKIREIHAILSQKDNRKASLSEEYLKPVEMRDTLGISPRSEWNWIRDKKLHPIRIGNKRLYKRAEIEKLFSENQDDSGDSV